jgi:hypothetical protein
MYLFSAINVNHHKFGLNFISPRGPIVVNLKEITNYEKRLS